MKVVHISASDLAGGAAIACKRIVDAESLHGIDSKLIVQKKISSDKKVFSTTTNPISKLNYNLRMILDEAFIRLLTNKERGRFSYPFIGIDISNHPIIKSSDIIHLHWINNGFLSLEALRKIGSSGKPIVWTLHDMWAFTGGCHYSLGCQKFESECKQCPALKLSGDNDTSNKIFKSKNFYERLNLTIVTCSKWLAQVAQKSFLLRGKQILNIPNPLDTEVYKPIDKISSRKKSGLDEKTLFILSGAMNLKDERKGFQLLVDALNILKTKSGNLNIELCVFGKFDDSLLHKIPYKVNQLGKLKSEEEIVSAYNSADVFVAPSLEDNLPNTILESMSCGTPVVAFNTGGIPDMIDNNQNGILAKLKSSAELAEGIFRILSDDELRKRMSEESRKKVLINFNTELVVKKYKELYNNLIENPT